MSVKGERAPRREVIVMVTTSYPRFPGDTVGTFMEPIARGLADRGHDVHVVLPWHPRLARGPVEGGVSFHPYHYAPHRALNVFGYAGALREDVRLRSAAWLVAPLAVAAAGWKARRVAHKRAATVIHGHWVVPGGAIAASAAGRLPLVISLHGSDVYVAERHRAVGRVARAAFARAAWVTACSDDLRERAIRLGAPADRSETVTYGVDPERFRPDLTSRARIRQRYGIPDSDPLLFAAGRFVRKKGFEYLIDAVASMAPAWPTLRLVVGGGGDLEDELRGRALTRGVGSHVLFPGVLTQDQVADHLAAADLIAVPSVRDDAGNVDGLPNIVMEALASGTALVTTAAGGIGAVVADGRTGVVVPERDPRALAAAIDRLLRAPALRATIGRNAREAAICLHGWPRVAERFEAAYRKARASLGPERADRLP